MIYPWPRFNAFLQAARKLKMQQQRDLFALIRVAVNGGADDADKMWRNLGGDV